MFLFLLSPFFACSTQKISEDVIRLSWEEGDVFHIASSQRMVANMTEESGVSLDPSTEENSFADLWSAEVVWTYRVIETNMIPTESDELYPYSLSGTGEQVALSVIKVSLDPTLNGDEDMLSWDPVTYLVFTSERNRLAGVIQFSNDDGERVETAYSSKELQRDWSVLSQSNLSMVPTYLAPYGTRWSGGERVLSNASVVVAEKQDEEHTDVLFEDVMGGEVVATRYQLGMPWPTWTVSSSLTARMLEETELSEIRANVPAMRPDAPEDFDYKAALARSIDLDVTQVLEETEIEAGEAEFVVREGYRPWAGSWWPLKKGELVFGHNEDYSTYSSLIREEVDVIKNEMDALSTEIRELRKDEEKKEELKEKEELFREKQKALIDDLVEFYKGFLRDLDGGVIKIEDGVIRKEAEEAEETEEGEEREEGWSFVINELSPMDKFALTEYLRGNTHPNPFYLSAWELLNSYNPGGESWWGHCNGWAAAAILTHEPREEKIVEAGDQSIVFSTADIKGLLTESHYSTRSLFYGERYNSEEDDISDLSPAHFHKLITFYLKEQRVPFVFDTTASEAVWNFPVWEAYVIFEEAEEAQTNTINVNTATLEELTSIETIDERTAFEIIAHREENGAFQSMEDLLLVDTYDQDTMAEYLHTAPMTRTIDVTVDLRFTSDGVDNDHVDLDQDNPEFFVKNLSYTLELDEKNNIVGGKWEDENEHPDFAWVPYRNPLRASDSNSENPYLSYREILNVFGEDIERE